MEEQREVRRDENSEGRKLTAILTFGQEEHSETRRGSFAGRERENRNENDDEKESVGAGLPYVDSRGRDASLTENV